MEQTLAIIKPDAVKNQDTGAIITLIENETSFQILGFKFTQLKKEQAQEFYSVHKERPFFNQLVDFMCSGPIVVIALQQENAVEEWRTLIGATDPKESADNTIRNKFGTDKERNAVHGSDSPENAQGEISFFFKNNNSQFKSLID